MLTEIIGTIADLLTIATSIAVLLPVDDPDAPEA